MSRGEPMIRAAFLRRMAAVVLAGLLFEVRVPGLSDVGAPREYPVLHGDGIEDDAPAIRAWLAGEPVWDLRAGALKTDDVLANGVFAIGSTVDMRTASRDVVITHNIFRGTANGFSEDAPMFHVALPRPWSWA